MTPDKHDLINLLAGLSSKWRETGTALKVEENYLEGLSTDSYSKVVKLTKVIDKWMHTQPSPVTWETVISAIKCPIINDKKVVDEIYHHIGKLI